MLTILSVRAMTIRVANSLIASATVKTTVPGSTRAIVDLAIITAVAGNTEAHVSEWQADVGKTGR